MPRRSATLALAAGVVAIGWSAIFVRWTHMPGIASAFYRVLFAALALWPFLLTRRERSQLTRPVVATTLLGGIFFAGDIGLYNIAVNHTSAANATFLGNNAPVFVGLITWGLTRRRPALRFWTALAVALAGALLIVAVDHRRLASASAADGLAVIASFCFALFLVVTERVRGACDSAILVALSASASAATLLVVALLGHVSLAIPGWPEFAALLGLAFICQIAGYFSLTWALGHLPATTTSVTMLGVAPLTAVFALLIFGERQSPLQILGDALILLGIWLANRTPAMHEPTPAME
ncbi:MAG TPA: DMT family transporter [Acidobacteriaceae bacterium]|nr:DMT family transporter [Acidobacteriaceae bacterium]